MKRQHLVLLIGFSGLVFILLFPELHYCFYDLNDANLHQIIAKQTADQILGFKSPMDFFSPTWACGFPLFGHYQMLPQLILACLYLLTFKLISISFIYHLLIVLLLVGCPWSFYFAVRRFGLSEKAALLGAFFSLTIQSNVGFGHEFQGYVAYGSGLYTQLFGMLLFPCALVLGYEFLSGKTRRLFWPLILSIALLLSHVFLIYLALLVLGFWWLFGLCGKRIPSLRRMLLLGILLFAATSFFLVPLLLNSDFHASSRYEPLAKLNSYGLTWVLTNLLNGELLDSRRLPLLSALALIGFFISRRRGRAELAWVLGFALALLLFAGRTTWGRLLDALPMSSDMHFERFIIGVHFFGAGLAGIGAAFLWEKIAALRRRGLRAASYVLLALVFVGILLGPFRYLSQNGSFVHKLSELYKQDRGHAQSLFSEIKEMNPSRVFAGPRSGWGYDFKLAGVPVYFIAGDKGLPVLGHLPFGWSLAGDFTLMLDPFRHDLVDLFAVSHMLSWRSDTYWGIDPVYTEGKDAVYWVSDGSYFEIVSTPTLVRADKYTYWNLVAEWMSSDQVRQNKFMRLDFEGKADESDYERVISAVDLLHHELRSRTADGWSVTERAAFQTPGLFDAASYETQLGVVLDEHSGDTWSADIKTYRPATVLLKVTYHPFWRARLNGKPAETIMVSPGFVAVNVPAGESRVEFQYKPAWWKWALLLLLFGTPSAVLLRERRRRYEHRSPEGGLSIRGSTTAAYLGVAVILALALSHILNGGALFLENRPPVGEELKPVAGYAEPERISLNGIPFDNGLSQHMSGSDAWTKIYRLNGDFSKLESWVGLTDKSWVCEGEPGAIFEVWVDNELKYRSPELGPGRRPGYVNVNLDGSRLLKLVVRPTGGAECVDAAWAGARLYK